MGGGAPVGPALPGIGLAVEFGVSGAEIASCEPSTEGTSNGVASETDPAVSGIPGGLELKLTTNFRAASLIVLLAERPRWSEAVRVISR